KGIETEPDYATVYHNKGWLLNKLGQPGQAVLFFEKALELEPDRAVTYENLADAYVNIGATQEAIKAFRKAAQLLASSHPQIKEQIDAKIETLTKGQL
ncbi:MAG: tetratricopeptide repeat protein, partial [Candidatus Omnitrophica bacterium]|nr:tetratricopeptide repeat protein [Candidatus Omnitrophota bacterium]